MPEFNSRISWVTSSVSSTRYPSLFPSTLVQEAEKERNGGNKKKETVGTNGRVGKIQKTEKENVGANGGKGETKTRERKKELRCANSAGSVASSPQLKAAHHHIHLPQPSLLPSFFNSTSFLLLQIPHNDPQFRSLHSQFPPGVSRRKQLLHYCMFPLWCISLQSFPHSGIRCISHYVFVWTGR